MAKAFLWAYVMTYDDEVYNVFMDEDMKPDPPQVPKPIPEQGDDHDSR